MNMLLHWRELNKVLRFKYFLSFFIILFTNVILKRVCYLWKNLISTLLKIDTKDWIKFIKWSIKYWQNLTLFGQICRRFYWLVSIFIFNELKKRRNLNAFPKLHSYIIYVYNKAKNHDFHILAIKLSMNE